MIDLCCTLFLDDPDSESGKYTSESESEADRVRANALKLLKKLRIQIEKRGLQQSLPDPKIIIHLPNKSWHIDASLN